MYLEPSNISGGIFTVSAVDLYKEIVIWRNTGTAPNQNDKWIPIARSTGGNQISPGRTEGSRIFIMNNWRFVPASQSHQIVITGAIGLDFDTNTNGQLFAFSLVPSQYRVSVEYQAPNIIDTVATSGGVGVSASDLWNFGNRSLTDKSGFSLSSAGVRAIWEFVLTNASSVSGSAGRALERIAKVLGVGNTSVTASNTARSTGDGSISQTITDNGDGSKTMSGSP